MMPINWNPTSRELRLFSAGQIVFAGIVAWLGWYRWDVLWPAWSLAPPIAVLGALGCVQPAAVRWFYRSWMAAVFPIGWVISHLLLAAIYYGMLTPIALIQRFRGHDPLCLKQGGRLDSFWIDVPDAPNDGERFFRQY